ncbi:hypothetical protein [Streptomyces sp. SID5643]|uniref:hypothetical protein n=1 Tax=Streptomyces sp. SID5643 TaxID=2690307 RepID=UPI001369F1FD|nr:hypothetical protein [Streptomyces sp. SID5643]MZF90623.1 hypothetical protein [Streptomyces sp. SID5643]
MAAATEALRPAEAAGDVLQQAWAHAYLGRLRDAVGEAAPARHDRLPLRQAGKVHLRLAHAPACLGERAEAAAEYRAALALEDRVPADVRDEARAGLGAPTAGRPAPPTRFAQ